MSNDAKQNNTLKNKMRSDKKMKFYKVQQA